MKNKKLLNSVKYLVGFTLAEILISLIILGVITAIGITSLIRHQTEKATVTKVIKMYSVLNDAWAKAKYENGGNIIFLWSDTTVEKIALERFINYFKTQKICDGTGECFHNKYISLNGSSESNWHVQKSAILHDSSSIGLGEWDLSCKGEEYTFDRRSNRQGCFLFFYDINGKNKGENKLGKDIFTFRVTQTGVKSADTNAECSLSIGNIHNGRGCVDWIIKNKNLDYLHDKTKGYPVQL